jgi:maltose O-acetyltransferase
MIVTLYRLLARLYYIIDDYRYRTRIRVLMARGLVVGKNVLIARTVVIDAGFPYLISIGNNCSIADQVRIWAHDAATFRFTGGHSRLGKVEIKDNCFIGDRSTVLPGVTIGPNVLVAAGSVVNRDIPPNSCVAGVPARVYARFDEYIERNRRQIAEESVFEYSDLVGNLDHLDGWLKARVWKSVQDGRHAYVRGNSGRNACMWNVD